jgi:DNA invertase Pin-like site-specific DNA recombinase
MMATNDENLTKEARYERFLKIKDKFKAPILTDANKVQGFDVYIYIRVSTKLQANEEDYIKPGDKIIEIDNSEDKKVKKDKHSLKAQKEIIEAYCKKNNWIITTTFKDVMSGKSMNIREDFQKMREIVKKGDKIVAYSLSRIGRNTSEILTFANELEAKGVGLHITDTNISLDGAGNKLFFNVLASVSQFERDLLSERISDTMQSMKRAGTLRQKPEFGWKMVDKVRIIDPDEQEVIDIIASYIKETPLIKDADIVRKLQVLFDQGLIKFRKSKKVHQSLVREIIKRDKLRE